MGGILSSFFKASCAALVALAPAAALAQEAPPPAQPMTTTPSQKAGLSKAIYEAILASARSDSVAALLRDAIRDAGNECPYVTDYQVFQETTGTRTLKVKCREHQLYSVVTRSTGVLTVTGGDGTIGPMLPKDGYITSFTGQRIDQYLNDQGTETDTANRPRQETPAETPAAAAQKAAAGDLGGSSSRLGWLIAIVAFNLLVIGALLFALDRFFRPGRANIEQLERQLADLRSEQKDQLVEQSKEIYQNIFAHPDGYFIARGAHGKRRFFPTILAAILYRDYGFKIREIKTS